MARFTEGWRRAGLSGFSGVFQRLRFHQAALFWQEYSDESPCLIHCDPTCSRNTTLTHAVKGTMAECSAAVEAFARLEGWVGTIG